MLPERGELSEKKSSRKTSVAWGEVNILLFLHLYSDFVFIEGQGWAGGDGVGHRRTEKLLHKSTGLKQLMF